MRRCAAGENIYVHARSQVLAGAEVPEGVNDAPPAGATHVPVGSDSVSSTTSAYIAAPRWQKTPVSRYTDRAPTT